MPDRVEALGIVNQELDVDQAVHRGRLLPADNGDHPRSQVQPSGISVISTDRRQDPRTNLLLTTLKRAMSQSNYLLPCLTLQIWSSTINDAPHSCCTTAVLSSRPVTSLTALGISGNCL